MTLSEKIFTINTLLIQIECFLFFHFNERYVSFKKKNLHFSYAFTTRYWHYNSSDSSEPVPLTHTHTKPHHIPVPKR